MSWLHDKQNQVELLQPWSTFVMKTKLPSMILEKMIKITDEVIENKDGRSDDPGAGELKDQFVIETKILEQEKVMEFFLTVCIDYVVQAFCQSDPLNRENTLKEEWFSRMAGMWINSQKDNEYFPIHYHTDCDLSTSVTSYFFPNIDISF